MIRKKEPVMRQTTRGALIIASCLAVVLLSSAIVTAYQKVQMMGIDELKTVLDNPDIAVIDVRTGIDWNSSEWKIRGAIREDPLDVDKWSARFPKDKTLIIYCA